MASSMLDEDFAPVDVQVDDHMIRVRFHGGLELATPVARFSRLQKATAAQRTRWESVGRGSGIHWPDVDEDISLRGLFGTARSLPEGKIEQVPVLITDLLKTTGRLNKLFEGRPFTPDGHLVGSIGEVVAEYIYDLQLEPCSTPQIDAYTKDDIRRSVQIKLTGKTGGSFGVRWPSSVIPDVLLCMRMTVNGFVEVYNGPFPLKMLDAKPKQKNGQIALTASVLSKQNPSLLRPIRNFDSINRWFQATPELADVA
jgi:hypothetical protein